MEERRIKLLVEQKLAAKPLLQLTKLDTARDFTLASVQKAARKAQQGAFGLTENSPEKRDVSAA